MFLDYAPAYFEYTAKVCFQGLPSVLCKILGVYQVGYKNKVQNVVVMENVIQARHITKTFDLKGSHKDRYVHLSRPINKIDDKMDEKSKFEK